MGYPTRQIPSLSAAKKIASQISLENPKQLVDVTNDPNGGYRISFAKVPSANSLGAFVSGRAYMYSRYGWVDENPIEEVVPLLIALAGALTVGVSVYLATKDKTERVPTGNILQGMQWNKGW